MWQVRAGEKGHAGVSRNYPAHIRSFANHCRVTEDRKKVLFLLQRLSTASLHSGITSSSALLLVFIKLEFDDFFKPFPVLCEMIPHLLKQADAG